MLCPVSLFPEMVKCFASYSHITYFHNCHTADIVFNVLHNILSTGFGDMAVSNSIGSNVFDILLGLGLPWLIQTGMVSPGSVVTINSSGLTVSSITLLATVVLLILAIVANKWRLTKPLGVFLVIVYMVVIAISCLFEVGVFGNKIGLPPCPI